MTCWQQQLKDNKDKMFNIIDYKLSIIIAVPKKSDSLRRSELLNNAGAAMLVQKVEDWNVLLFSFDNDGSISELQEQKITKDSFLDYDWKIVRVIAQKMEDKKRG